MTHDEMIEVIQAHKDGKAIEVFTDDNWREMDRKPSWQFDSYHYRVKSYPKEYWLVPYLNNTGFTVFEANPSNLPAAFHSPSSVWSEGLDFSSTIHVVTVEELTND
jgi:hypothetical protein